MDDNTPVLVGVATYQQQNPDYHAALEPVAMMERALRDAATDAGDSRLLAMADDGMVDESRRVA